MCVQLRPRLFSMTEHISSPLEWCWLWLTCLCFYLNLRISSHYLKNICNIIIVSEFWQICPRKLIHHACCLWCLGWNAGLDACYSQTLRTELHTPVCDLLWARLCSHHIQASIVSGQCGVSGKQEEPLHSGFFPLSWSSSLLWIHLLSLELTLLSAYNIFPKFPMVFSSYLFPPRFLDSRLGTSSFYTLPFLFLFLNLLCSFF